MGNDIIRSLKVKLGNRFIFIEYNIHTEKAIQDVQIHYFTSLDRC